MDTFKKGWFSETSSKLWPGQCFSLEVENVLVSKKTKYQDLVLFDSKTYGRVLALDGVIQLTERTECAYQEMVTHIPLYSHPEPKSVLIIGGGDGCILREVLKHDTVRDVHLCDIDGDVIDLSKEYLSEINQGSLEDPRSKIFVEDGFKFLKNAKSMYDVILTDSSDPVGPAETLYQEEFYSLCSDALKKGGIFCCQGECMWLHSKSIKSWMGFLGKKFKGVGYYAFSAPAYPCGTIGCMIAFRDTDVVKKSVRKIKQESKKKMKFYSEKVHKAVFCLPKFVEEILK